MLFYAFLTKSKICSIEEILNFKQYDKENAIDNERILSNLNINLKALSELKKSAILHNNEELIHNLSDKIMNINELSKDTYDDKKDDNGRSLTEFDKKLKKIQVAMDKFSRLGESEIVTPKKICDEMINQFTDKELEKILDSGKKILDINSKIGEFTVAIIDRFKRMGITTDSNKKLEDLIYSIPSESYTYEFTRYVYEVLGLNIDNISTHFTSYSLIKNENVYKSKEEIEKLVIQKKNIGKELNIINKYNDLLEKKSLSKKERNNKEKIEKTIKEIILNDDIDENLIIEHTNGLNEELEIIEKKVSQNIDYDKICIILNQNKKFSDIKLSDEVKESDDNMKFEAVVGNPPYHENTGGGQAQGLPIYDKFMLLSQKLSNLYSCLIVQSRWFNGGFPCLKELRKMYKLENSFKKVFDYFDADDCFGNNIVEIKGGVNYYLWEKGYKGKCEFANIDNGIAGKPKIRDFIESDLNIIIRYNEFSDILKKILKKGLPSFASIVSPLWIHTTKSSFDSITKNKQKQDDIYAYVMKDEGWVRKKEVVKNTNYINKFKIYVPRSVGSANIKTDKLKPIIAGKNTCCSGTYIMIGPFDSRTICENVSQYIQTKFFHMLLMLKRSSVDCTQESYEYIPLVDITKKWNDLKLYKYFDLTPREISIIEKTVWASIDNK